MNTFVNNTYGFDGISKHTASVFGKVKNGFKWGGRQLQKGFNGLGKQLKGIWNSAFPYMKAAATAFIGLLNTPGGLALPLISACLLCGYATYRSYGVDSTLSTVVLATTTVALTALTTALLICGLQTGLATPLL